MNQLAGLLSPKAREVEQSKSTQGLFDLFSLS
jgi:hypothetical protein